MQTKCGYKFEWLICSGGKKSLGDWDFEWLETEWHFIETVGESRTFGSILFGLIFVKRTQRINKRLSGKIDISI